MSLKKFQPEDILLNTMKAHPSCEFFIFDGNVYYNNRPFHSGAFTGSVVSPEGFISLYEYNIDRSYYGTYTVSRSADHWPTPENEFGEIDYDTTGPVYTDYPVKDKAIIYPYITKDGTGDCWSTVSSTDYYNLFRDGEPNLYGTVLTSSYPMTASITREYMTPAGARFTLVDCKGGDSDTCAELEAASVSDADWVELANSVEAPAPPKYRHYFALRNRLNLYASTKSPEFAVTGAVNGTTYEWIKDEQTINLISIPSIFYGSRIQPGSLSLKWYFTGSLIGELQDTKRNGELIQISTGSTPYDSALPDNSGSVAGVALYDEGIILLTGSWALNGSGFAVTSSGPSSPAWIYFGAGANDGVDQGSTATSFMSASFNLSFRGQTNTQVMTLFTHAKKGKANWSNNPTYIKYGQEELRVTSSMVYEENPDRIIANTVSSSYSDYSASFKREVYVSKVAIYDENKNLIGVTTLSNPVLKEEDQDLTFKLRLDI